MLRILFENQVADAVLTSGVDDGAQEGEGTPLAVDGILTGREGDVPASTCASLPHAEANQLQARQRTFDEVQDLEIKARRALREAKARRASRRG